LHRPFDTRPLCQSDDIGEEGEQDDDRDRHTEKPKNTCAGHDFISIVASMWKRSPLEAGSVG
jgi:hypothetical protein